VLKLNLFRIALDRPDGALPYLQLPKDRRAKDVFPALYDPAAAARVVSTDNYTHIVFLRGEGPRGVRTGKMLYEWTAWNPLAKAILELSLADFLRPRFTLEPQKIDRHPWGFTAMRPTLPRYKHVTIEEGISFRAAEVATPAEFAMVIQWKAHARFTTTLADSDMQLAAPGNNAMYIGDAAGDDQLARFIGRTIGRVESFQNGQARVTCRDDKERLLNPALLQLEPSTKNLALIDRLFPKLAPPGGTVSTTLRADKSLDGNIRNRRIFRDRLEAIIQAIAPNHESTIEFPLCFDRTRHGTIHLEPLSLKYSPELQPLTYLNLPQPGFRYKTGTREETSKKTDGLVKLGPFAPAPKERPSFGFIFPESYREDARNLYTALRDGTGYFRGLPNWFRMPFSKEQVTHISGFDVPNNASPEQASLLYKNALDQWLRSQTVLPDLFFVVHDKTEAYEELTPYYTCKAILLDKAVMTQNVTVSLLRNPQQFEWAAANIALAAFAKLGGRPWTVEPCSKRSSLIIGIGTAEKHDPASRTRKRYQAFATCVSSKGVFGFSSVSPTVDTEEELTRSLSNATSAALAKAESLNLQFDSLVVHLAGNLKRDEREAAEAAARAYRPTQTPLVCVLSISDRADMFAISNDNEFGMPARGTCIRVAHSQFLLFTEGIEDLRSAARRTPCSVQVRLRHVPDGVDPLSLIAQVYDLSQVNFRGFNGASKPVSLLYSETIARALKHADLASALAKHPELNERMWFL
jgi:hypothetical protein